MKVESGGVLYMWCLCMYHRVCVCMLLGCICSRFFFFVYWATISVDSCDAHGCYVFLLIIYVPCCVLGYC